jgi:hypothetical protein
MDNVRNNNPDSNNPSKNTSTVSISATDRVRNFLFSRNLESSYLNDNNPIQPFFGVQEPGSEKLTQFYDKSVIDQETVQEGGLTQQGLRYLDNRYGPDGGYSDVLTIDVDKLSREHVLEYLEGSTLKPKTFVQSCYNAYDILNTVNISNGVTTILNPNVLEDSELMKISAGRLRQSIGENLKYSKLYYDIDDAISISTTPGEEYLKHDDYLSRLSGVDVNYSEIGSTYLGYQFIPDVGSLVKNMVSFSSFGGNIQATANALGNYWNGSNNVPANNQAVPTPSNNLIDHLNDFQQTRLFTHSLNFNKYRPDYSRVKLHSGVKNVIPYYYVGSSSAEPGNLESPSGAIPSDVFGREVKSLVYGPSVVAKELETVNGKSLWKHYLFGLNGLNYDDGGGLAGGFTWFGHKSFASTEAPMGMLYTRSFNKPKRRGGLLDQTQKLIDSAPLMGGARRKHAGHAIDQTSKVFNDGYKDIGKGSSAKFIDKALLGGVNASVFCRTWTKDNPYYTFKNLQRSGGLMRGNKDSVLTNTFNLNIGPSMGGNIDDTVDSKNVKKYMFSIENLAWRGAPEMDSLPMSEKGPNGGRVMWFPPYDINISDTNSTQWSPTNFLGRTEPVYTYNSTERMGSLSFKIVVDHPSILNVIVDKELKGIPDQTADSVIESFLAGCSEFDIYELADKYGDLLSLVELEGISMSASEIMNIVETNEGTSGTTGDTGTTTTGSGTTGGGVGGTESSDTGGVGGEESDISAPTETDELENNKKYMIATDGKINAKKVLTKLLAEQNYFKHLEEHEEFVYASLKRQIKHFHPSFHSMTPEGLNSRLTFLLQCGRPGRTIPVVSSDGETMDDTTAANNTAFGPPPICVLRIGDFYHTKIAIDNVSLTYDPLVFDLNPEGIGVQPMIANVQMNFKFIGGQSLKGPVSKLQNALTHNFFANTEVFDARADESEFMSLTGDSSTAAVSTLMSANIDSVLSDINGSSAGEE